MPRLRDLRTAPTALKTEFLIQAAAMAIQRWDRLTPTEQRRFRELAAQAGNGPSTRLPAADRKELRRLWKKLEVRKLVGEALRLLTRSRE